MCSASDLARAYGISDEEINRIIEESKQELIEAGEDPNEYFREVPVIGFMM